MRKLTTLFILTILHLLSYGQVYTCGTVQPETDPLQGISFKVMDADRVYQFNLMYTVLYLNPSDTVKLSREWLRAETDIMNTYFRQLNTDINQVPEPFRGLALDARVQINMVGVRYVKSGNTAFPSFLSFFDPEQGGINAYRPQDHLNYYYAPYTWSTGVAIFPEGTVGQWYHGAVTSLSAALSAITNHYTAWVNVHEIYHNLGLYHTFQGGCAETNCVTGGDRVCDTPPCTTGGGCLNLDAGCGNGTQANRHNHMDYSDRITCAKMVTAGQVDRVHTHILAYFGNHIGDIPQNEPPTCTFTNPTQDTVMAPNTYITLRMAASDDKAVKKVELWMDTGGGNVAFTVPEGVEIFVDSNSLGQILYVYSQPPYWLSMRPTMPMRFQFYAIAEDSDGERTQSETRIVDVRTTPPPPPTIVRKEVTDHYVIDSVGKLSYYVITAQDTIRIE